MGLIARLNLSFNFWNDPGVRNLFSGYAEKFKVPCSSDSMTALLKPYAQGVRDRLKLELKDKLLCLKFDIASRRHRSFIGISVQFINNWKIEVRALKMATIRGKTDSISLQVLIEDCLREFGVDKRQIYTVTTDNGANVLKTSKLLLMASTQLEWDDEEEEEEPVNSLPIFFDFDENDENQEIYLEDFDLPEETPEAPLNIDEEEDDATEIIHAIQSSIGNYGDLETRCAAHVVQLAVHDIMNTERKTLIRVTKKKVGAVIKYIRTMPDDDNRPSLPKYPTDTRWNSTYYMIESLFKIREKLVNSGIKISWEALNVLKKVLAPVEVLTKRLQAEQLIAGNFMADLHECRHELRRIVRHQHSAATTTAAEHLLRTLETRCKLIVDRIQFQAAILLDPRFVNCGNGRWLTSSQMEDAMDFIEEVRSRVVFETADLVSTDFENRRVPEESNDVPFSPTFDEIFFQEGFESPMKRFKPNEESSFRDRLQKLTQRSMESPKTDVLQYWHREEKMDKELATVAQVILQLPLTQVAVERSFSHLPLILTARRERLGAKTIDDLCMIKFNNKKV